MAKEIRDMFKGAKCIDTGKADKVNESSVDRVVICRGDPTGKIHGQLCPQCGAPLLLTGRETLGAMPVDRRAYCEKCQFEEDFSDS